MNHQDPLPSDETVRKAVQDITEQARELGRRPSVLAVARRVGLSNTTFRRNFPDHARQIGQTRRNDPYTGDTAAERHHNLLERNAKLQRDNTQLLDHLELATANIMRLTLENKRLGDELQAVTGVTRIGRSGRRQVDPPPRT